VAERGKVVILDRDGTIVIDRGYLDNAAGLEFLPGAAAGLHALYSQGNRLVVITNQSGVGRGLFPIDRVYAMNARLNQMIEEAGARLAGIYFCPHTPDESCDCRKPNLGLMTLAAAELNFDPAESVVIGDKDSDIEFGRRAGAKTILIAQAPAGAGRIAPDAVAPNLIEAARKIADLRRDALG
jgi:D-glycero-D-manno-heptose 1,7-bisphosphate phosphatase